MKGSEILINALKKENVDLIFGYPGGAVLDIYDSLYFHPEIRHVLTAHEQGAVHAADGYARVTGKTGVCLATSGPGATNLVTGIATAYMDSVPIVAITGNVSTGLLGKDSFQEVDIFNITMPVTKHNFIVKDVGKIAETVHRAFEIASSGRPGPVLVDITADALSDCSEIVDAFEMPERRVNVFTKEELKKAAKMIDSSKKPLLYVGGGAVRSGCGEEIKKLAGLLSAPVCDTLMGKGIYPGNSENYLGMLGIHGTEEAKEAMKEADLLIAVGTRFSDRATGNFKSLPEKAGVIHIDIDPAEINKNLEIDVSLVGDAKCVLTELITLLHKKERKTWKSAAAHVCHETAELTCRGIVSILDSVLPKDTVIVTDVGQHQMIAASDYAYTNPRTFLSSGGLGTMGFGLPAAIGASLGRPGKKTVCISGDGSFRMNMIELATAKRSGADVLDIVIDNRALGLVKELQAEQFEGRYSYTDVSDGVSLSGIASAMGVVSAEVSSVSDFKEALSAALEREGTGVLVCNISYEQERQ